MDKRQIHTYDVELEVLTPVIINTGEYYQLGELQPTGEKVDTVCYEAGLTIPTVYKWSQIDLTEAITHMPRGRLGSFTDEAISAISSRNNDELIGIRDELNQVAGNDNRKEVRVLETADSILSKKPLQQISRIATSPLSREAYIPGSSLKGAIRTGFLEWLRKEKHYDYYTRREEEKLGSDGMSEKKGKKSQGHKFEMEMLTDKQYNWPKSPPIPADPFKFIKVSDFVFSDEESGIEYLTNVNDSKGIPIYTAMTNSFAYSGKKITAKGTIIVNDRFFNSIKGDFEFFLKIVDDFYSANLDLIKEDITSCPLMDYIYREKYVREKEKGAFLVKLGHYIGADDHKLKVNSFRKQDEGSRKKSRVKLEGDILPGICTIKVKEIE